MIDFTGHDKIIYSWEVDEFDVATITFKNSTEVTTLGSIKIERTRLASFLDSLRHSGDKFMPRVEETTNREFYRAKFDNTVDKTTLEFS